MEGSQDYDLALRVLERIPPAHVRHIPRVLYHWRAIQGSTALDVGAKSYATLAARKALQAHFERTGSGATCQPGPGGTLHRAVYPLPPKPPLVSLLVSTRAGVDAAQRSGARLLQVTDYPHLELLTVGDSASANAAVRQARGEVLVFVDGGLEALEPGWLAELVGHALRPEVGAVGARIVLPEGTIDHGGYLLGLGPEGTAGVAHRGLKRQELGYFGRASIGQNFSAVSDAGLALRRDVFEAVGGFEATHLPDVWRDVDLCLRIRERGWRIVWTPYADLCRSGPASGEVTPEVGVASHAVAYMKERWSAALREDPHYSPNLALGREPFGLAWPPRIVRPW
jgi:O-antigen biosynthesis protein